MPVAREAQSGHADRHDLDKLGRWKAGLDGAADSAPFPVGAIFLVGPQDRAAHDVFRRYRSIFEELGGGFAFQTSGLAVKSCGPGSATPARENRADGGALNGAARLMALTAL